MVNDGIRPIIINLLLVGLFFVAIITGAGIMLAQNHASQSILNNSLFADTNNQISGNLTDYYNVADSSERSFENSTVTLSSGIPFIDSIYGTWKIIKKAPVMLYTLVVDIVFKTLLGDQTTTIILNVIGAILMITIIFAIVKLISSGEGG